MARRKTSKMKFSLRTHAIKSFSRLLVISFSCPLHSSHFALSRILVVEWCFVAWNSSTVTPSRPDGCVGESFMTFSSGKMRQIRFSGFLLHFVSLSGSLSSFCVPLWISEWKKIQKNFFLMLEIAIESRKTAWIRNRAKRKDKKIRKMCGNSPQLKLNRTERVYSKFFELSRLDCRKKMAWICIFIDIPSWISQRQQSSLRPFSGSLLIPPAADELISISKLIKPRNPHIVIA